MFRSGRLNEARVAQIVRWVERMPHNLRAVAKACRVYPPDLLAWYAAGQDLECADRWMVELAWEIDRIRAEKAAANYARIEAAANGGTKRKVVTKPGGEIEETIEDVLPQAWAIERLDALQEASPWEICPTGEQAAELHAMMRELEPTPLLGSGVDEKEVPDRVLNAGQGDVKLAPLGDAVPVDVVGIEGIELGQGDGVHNDERPVVAEGDVLSNDVHTQSLTEPE